MRRMARTFIILLCACLAGVGAGELLSRTSWSRSVLGRMSGRGEFVSTARGTAYFATDLDDPRAVTAIIAADLRRRLPRRELVKGADVERELSLLQDQFGEPEAFRAALAESDANDSSLRAAITDHLEIRGWIEERIAPQLRVTTEECRQLYESRRANYRQPKRYRARHLFVAAPDGAAPEVIAEKRGVAEGLAVRVLAGESLADLAAEASEDEATKFRGGDLGYFSVWRMPPEFMAELAKLAIGQLSPPFRSHLGFHIVELTEVKLENELTFEQARPEIVARIANEKRATAVEQWSLLILTHGSSS